MTNDASAVVARRYSVPTPDGSRHEFDGVRLGTGTSRRDSHLHPPGDRAPIGVRCSGCRWTDTAIYRSETDGRYVVSIVGRSVIPGEVDKVKTVWTETADGVLDALLVPPPRHLKRDGPLELPQPNADALDRAAERDRQLADALRSWDAAA